MASENQTHFAELISILQGSESAEVRLARALSYLSQLQADAKPSEEHHFADAEPVVPSEAASARNEDDLLQPEKKGWGKLVGVSQAMQAVYAAVRQVGPTEATVLVRGESGTGKELIARAIHAVSPRRRKPFVPVHCAALPESLIESTLFGYERGAFTGAVRQKKGRLDHAAGGTVFLDEIGDIPLSTQVKLLRLLQEKEYERVGGTETIEADIRVIAATHRNLEAMVHAGEFREDLYYRINVVPIELPPLRERMEDIPLLITHFLERLGQRYHRRVELGRDLLALMSRYQWPGNVRELQNCVERLVVMAEGERLTRSNIPVSLQSYFQHMRDVASREQSPRKVEETFHRQESLSGQLHSLERQRLEQVLAETGWVKAKAARILGMTPRQVAYKIKKYRLSRSSQHRS